LKVGESAMQQGKGVPILARGVDSAIYHTRKCLDAGFKAKIKAPNKVFVISFEQLLNDLEEETKRMCQYLNIEWSEQMMHPGEFKHLGERGMTCAPNSIWYDRSSFNRDPESKEINKWMKMLRPDQQIRISRRFKNYKELSEYGYDLSLNHLSNWDRIRGLIVFLIGAIFRKMWFTIRKLLKFPSYIPFADDFVRLR
jgi:hypothetical protein